MTERAILALEDGTVFEGVSIGAPATAVGEVVFNTAMTGYQEILTDPSYASQLVTLTYPHIGNTGCNSVDQEAGSPHAAGLVVRDVPQLASSWRQQLNLPEYLRTQGVPCIADLDTRKLTRLLRSEGAQNGCLMAGPAANQADALAQARAFPGLAGMDLAKVVTTEQSYQWTEGSYDLDRQQAAQPATRLRVVAYDFGVKRNILRLLADRGCEVTVVPAQTPADQVLALEPDGVFLSNGPGDPEPCAYAVAAIRAIVAAGKPVFGICLGHQLLALASGARTEKMKFGHHGANHPVQDLASQRVFITSQNHGFAVAADSLPATVEVTHRSLFDGTIQGIVRKDAAAFGFQGHPEASPGPHDIAPLFDRFIQMMQPADA